MMQIPWLSKYTPFSGRLQGGEHIADVSFSARVTRAGEVEFAFEPFQIADYLPFAALLHNNKGPGLVRFSLVGKAENGTEIDTSDLHLHLRSSREKPVGSYIRTTFRRKLTRPAPKPMLRVLLKGFGDCPALSTTCRLGTIQVAGATSRLGPDITTGSIVLSPEDVPGNLHAWRSQAEELLAHVRLIMSFGAGAMLRAPIVEFWTGEEVEVTALSQTRQSLSPIPTFNFMRQRQRHAFDVAVKSFFSPTIKIKNLFFAIEWFVMETTYNEVRLIYAMTALENILASNLTDEDNFLQPVDPGADETPEGKFDGKIREEKFEKETRRALQKVISKCLAELKWPPPVRRELYGKLAELNRRALLRRLKILTERWLVPVDAILWERIQAAKDARDNIVHRGHFQEGHETRDWEHVTVVREIVVRFILKAIGYQGEYGCYIGAPHYAQFSPDVSDDQTSKGLAMENATVRLRRVEGPPDVKAYMLDERQHLEGNEAHLVMVEFRVNVGRDAFPVQVLLDRRETAEDQLVPEARRRAAAMFREALNTLESREPQGS